jgi:hypothetical protein
MRQKIAELLEATLALVNYIEENQVFDKLADCGCGGLDSYRSDKFVELINSAKKAANELNDELLSTLSP